MIMKKQMKKMVAGVLVGLMALGAAGCGSKANDAGTPAAADAGQQTAALDQVAVTYVKAPLNVPSIIEKDKGMLAKNFGADTKVVYSDLTTGPEQTQALASGDIQFLNAVGATSVILSASNGADIKIISMYSRSPKAFELFTNDPTITSAADLAGKKIAGPKGTILHELLVAYLATADLTQDDVEFVDMSIPNSQAALESGDVDCALVAGPTAYNQEEGGKIVLTTGEGLVDATICVAASQKFIDERPEAVETFLKTQKEVLDYMAANEAEIMDITAKEVELTPEEVQDMYGQYDFDMTIKDSDIKALKQTEQFLFDNQMIENRVDVEQLIWK